jgi:hypothetical protein
MTVPAGWAMAEDEWLTCTDPDLMLKFLLGKASDRKLRLFACACCRRIWPLIEVGESRRAVEMAEQLADKMISEQEAHAMSLRTEQDALRAPERSSAVWACHHAIATEISGQSPWDAAYFSAQEACAASAGLNDHCPPWDLSNRDEAQLQCELLRDLFGCLFFRPVALDPSWVRWNAGTVVRVAQALYEDRAFNRRVT